MDERAEKAKRRFENMLADARAAVAEASGGIPSGELSPRALLVATKALNRAGGFLEAVSITLPELVRGMVDADYEEARRDHLVKQAGFRA